MNHKLSILFSQRLIQLGIISKEHEEIYVYGFELILSFMSSVTIVLFLGAIIHKIIETLIFLTLFIVIRRFTGGFHAETYLKCQICTIGFYLCVLGLTLVDQPSLLIHVLLMIFGTLIIILIGPIESPYKPLSNKQRKINMLRGVVLFESAFLIGVFLHKRNPYISNVIFYSLLLIIILMIIPHIGRRIHHA